MHRQKQKAGKQKMKQMSTKEPKCDRQAAKLASKEKRAERLEKYDSIYHYCERGPRWRFYNQSQRLYHSYGSNQYRKW